jgi:orotate phosphoribosyltransferase
MPLTPQDLQTAKEEDIQTAFSNVLYHINRREANFPFPKAILHLYGENVEGGIAKFHHCLEQTPAILLVQLSANKESIHFEYLYSRTREQIQADIKNCIENFANVTGQLYLPKEDLPRHTFNPSLVAVLAKAVTVRHDKPFRMASGAFNPTMCDLSQVLRTQEGLNTLISTLKTTRLEQASTVGGPLCGSDLISAAVMLAHPIPKAFGVRPNPKGRGYDSGDITGNLSKDDKVLLVEDVCTTGQNLIRASISVTRSGAKIVQVLTVVDRGGLTNVEKTLNWSKAGPPIPCIALTTLDELLAYKNS